VRVFVFSDLSRKLLPFAFRRASGRKAGINAISYDRTKRAARVFVFSDLSRKLLPFAFRRASGRKAGINAISYDIKQGLIIKPSLLVMV